jgi:hypothetical protein
MAEGSARRHERDLSRLGSWRRDGLLVFRNIGDRDE